MIEDRNKAILLALSVSQIFSLILIWLVFWLGGNAIFSWFVMVVITGFAIFSIVIIAFYFCKTVKEIFNLLIKKDYTSSDRISDRATTYCVTIVAMIDLVLLSLIVYNSGGSLKSRQFNKQVQHLGLHRSYPKCLWRDDISN